MKQPTSEQCSNNEIVFETEHTIGYAIWHPQMGGYVGKAIVELDKKWYEEEHRKHLPCFPCPHDSHCCKWGVDLTDEEAVAITHEFGNIAIDTSEKRTSIINGQCFFSKNNACIIHDKPYYPAVCKCFPWTDGILGGVYTGDRTDCLELTEDDV